MRTRSHGFFHAMLGCDRVLLDLGHLAGEGPADRAAVEDEVVSRTLQ
jgi:hypothetical protein